MARPKDSKHSNRYRGNELMIGKIQNCVDRANGLRDAKPIQQQQDAQAKAALKRERKLLKARNRA